MLDTEVVIHSIKGKEATLDRDDLERIKRDMGLERHSFLYVTGIVGAEEGSKESQDYYMIDDDMFFEIMCKIDDMRIVVKNVAESLGYGS